MGNQQEALNGLFQMRQHPDREGLYHELHARPFPVVAKPFRISHLAFLVTRAERDADFDHLCALCRRYGVNPPQAGENSFNQTLGDFEVRWERHLEFVTYTFMRQGASDVPFSDTALTLLPRDWLSQLSGSLVVALHLELPDDNDHQWKREALAGSFEGHRLISAELMASSATLWSAFRLHGDGFGRILLRIKDLSPNQTGRLVQRVLELETYRLMALLSASQARELAPKLADLDMELSGVITELSEANELKEERHLLRRLTSMAALIERHRAETTNRFAATKAYYQIVLKRLEELDESHDGKNFTLMDFLGRRLTPAVNTCDAMSLRLEDLARRIERAGDLIRTRVDLKLEEQNRSLLASMDRRSHLQLRLQETVEGLSIAAISYYGVSLLNYLFIAVEPVLPWLQAPWATAASVPLVVLSVWLITRRIKRMIIRESNGS